MSRLPSPLQKGFGERFSALIDAKRICGGDRDAVADLLGLKDSSAVSHYKAGRRVPGVERLAAIAREAGVSTDYLLSLSPNERGTIEREVHIPDPPMAWSPFVRIPLAHEKVSGGFPALATPEDPSEGKKRPMAHAFRKAFLRTLVEGHDPDRDPKRFKVCELRGESMAPTIASGAVLLVDCWPAGLGPRSLADIRQGEIYVVSPVGVSGLGDGERGLTAKRLYVADDRLILVADNRAFPAATFTPDDNVRLSNVVIGRVCWVGQTLVPRKKRTAQEERDI